MLTTRQDFLAGLPVVIFSTLTQQGWWFGVEQPVKARHKGASISLSRRQEELQNELSHAIGAALPWAIRIDGTLEGARSPYRGVAEVLVALRHEFPGPNGQACDLKGRSAAYRAVVRNAYVQAGADPNSSLSKKLTAGTAYWVRKILLERYGKRRLCEMGIISNEGTSSPIGRRTVPGHIGQDRLKHLQEVVGTLNVLASDPEMIPTEELVRAAIRAVNILKQKLTSRKESDRFTHVAV